MSMSAHVSTMRKQDRQDDTTEELPEENSKTHHPGHVSIRNEH